MAETIGERVARMRELIDRELRLADRLKHAAFWLQQAEQERAWAVIAAAREGLSVRKIGSVVVAGQGTAK